MRKALLFIAPLVLFLCASSAFADGIDYTASGSREGTTFTFSFTEPTSTIASLDTFTTVEETDNFGGSYTFPGAEVKFFPLPSAGLFDIIFSSSGDTFVFAFFGPQIYSGASAPFTLLTGTFPVSDGGIVIEVGKGSGAFDGGTVTATPVTATPEPATFALLGTGLFALGALRKKKRLA